MRQYKIRAMSTLFLSLYAYGMVLVLIARALEEFPKIRWWNPLLSEIHVNIATEMNRDGIPSVDFNGNTQHNLNYNICRDSP